VQQLNRQLQLTTGVAERALQQKAQPGPIGPAGPVGAAGPKGEKGEKGEQGLQGLRGLSGADAVLDPKVLAQLTVIQTTVQANGNLLRQNQGILKTTQNSLNAVNGQVQQAVRQGKDLLDKTKENFEKISKRFKLGEALNAFILAVTIHNALQLTADIGRTLGSVVDLSMRALGLKDPDTGEAYNFTEILGKNAKSLLISMVGQEMYDTTAKTWNNLNRTYRAVTNLADTMMSLVDDLENLVTYTAGNVNMVANALKIMVIPRDAYRNLPQNVSSAVAKANRLAKLRKALEEGQEIAQNLQNIAQSVVDTQETIKQGKENFEELHKAFGELTEEEAKPKEEAKKDSQGADIPIEKTEKQ
ncbi:collagen-like protein, partial [Moorena sp. SIO1G6]|uniref:collagen-like triple helix repeat-containing protein n=1 Tax=Moorena sp. SIO1G6 TaxID=2607840 RepID=UPI00257E7760